MTTGRDMPESEISPQSESSLTIPATTRITNSPETVASEGVELTVVPTKSPGASRDAGLAFALTHCTAACIPPRSAAATTARQAHGRVHRHRAHERFL